MSGDENFLLEVLEALRGAKLDYVLIGGTAAALHGVPILTQDIDIFVRDTDLTRKKIREFTRIMGGLALTRPQEPFSEMIRAIGADAPIDFVFSLSSGKSFESVRSRAVLISIGRKRVRVASLEDIIEAKEKAGRAKDRATIEILRETLAVKKAIERAKKG